MPRSSTLTLVVPRLFERLEDHSVDPLSSTDSVLAAIAGRGHLERRWHADSFEQARLKPWQRGLLHALQLDEGACPSAALSAVGAGITATDDSRDWLHAEPIHLAVGMKEVTLVPLTFTASLTKEERDALSTRLQEHITNEGFELRPTASSEWLVGSTRPFNVQSVCTEYAMRSEWNAVLPKGEGSGHIRRLMTELQMLLHDHPINEARALRNVPSVNALWLWGSGVAAAARKAGKSHACFGDNDYLRGICSVNGWNAPSYDVSVDAAIGQAKQDQTTVFVLTNLLAADFDTRWLAPAVAALKRDAISRLELVIDEWHLTIDRWQLRKFWRGALPLDSWARA
jgi:hypothetical protein